MYDHCSPIGFIHFTWDMPNPSHILQKMYARGVYKTIGEWSHIHTHIYIYIDLHICMYMYMCMYIHMHLNIYIYTYICIYIYIKHASDHCFGVVPGARQRRGAGNWGALAAWPGFWCFYPHGYGTFIGKNDKRWGHVNMWRNLYKLRKMIETLYGSMFQDCLSHTLGKIPLLKHLGRSPGQGFDHETSLGLGLYLGVVLLTNRSARLLLGRTLRLWRRSYFHF